MGVIDTEGVTEAVPSAEAYKTSTGNEDIVRYTYA